MWTATLISLNIVRGILIVDIEYSDGTDTFRRRYRLETATKRSLIKLARNEVNRIVSLKAEVIDLTIGDSIDITPDPVVPPPAPTPAQIARTAWFDDFDKLRKFLNLANSGLMDPADTKITNLQASLTTDWLNSYLDGI